MTDRETLINAALQWAQAMLGDPRYAGQCYAFVEDAYELGGHIILDGQGATAKEAADAYRAGEHTEAPPPRGAYVFYDCRGPLKGETRNWGHMGLSLGDGRILHAWNVVRLDHYLDLENIDPAPGWTSPVYLGWAPVEVIWRGSRPGANPTPARPSPRGSQPHLTTQEQIVPPHPGENHE